MWTGFIPIAVELGKSLFAIIAEAVGADASKLEELHARFMNLLKLGTELLEEARAESKTAQGYTEERRAAAVARIKAARIAQAAAPAPEFKTELVTHPKTEDR